MKPLRLLPFAFCLLPLFGCATHAPYPVGPNTWQVSRGGWPTMDGLADEAACYEAANKFCAERGLVMVTNHAITVDGRVFAHNASSKLIFTAVPTNSVATK